MKNPYTVLGLSNTATRKDIRIAFKTLSYQAHPALNGGKVIPQKNFRKIAEAYAVLSDLDKRGEIDLAIKNNNKNGVNISTDKEDFTVTKYEDVKNKANKIDQNIYELHHRRSECKTQAIRQLVKGLIILAIALLITYISYRSAVENGKERYTIFIGAIIVGVIAAGKGIFSYIEMRSELINLEELMWSKYS
ncbi:MAG: DnaJ domain-containing protein [Oscillospiraceae bacterium]